MNRSILQSLSTQRRRDAFILLRERHFPGAYYLIGYAVECALKACVARQTRRFDFPTKGVATKVFTHDLELLIKLAGLEADLARDIAANPTLQLNWTIVKDWSEETRYDLTITGVQARDLYSACTARTHGILSWIRKRW